MSDPYDLQRFIQAQDPVFERVCAELAAGDKQAHWMWYVFPQLKALGRSSTAHFYGIRSIEEARAYWAHATLGPRLARCTTLVVRVAAKSAHDIFHSPDDLKFRSCMTLFAEAAGGEPLFRQALDRFFDGAGDEATLALLCAR